MDPVKLLLFAIGGYAFYKAFIEKPAAAPPGSVPQTGVPTEPIPYADSDWQQEMYGPEGMYGPESGVPGYIPGGGGTAGTYLPDGTFLPAKGE